MSHHIINQRILKYGTPVLKKAAKLVEDYDNWKTLKDELWKVYEDIDKPQGLSAPQIGISKRLIICRLSGKPIVMFNPVVLKTFGSKKSNEGCESVNGRYIVKRPLLGKVMYADEEGKIINRWYRWKHMRVICHEVQHLDGICICDVGERWIR